MQGYNVQFKSRLKQILHESNKQKKMKREKRNKKTDEQLSPEIVMMRSVRKAGEVD